MRAFLKTVTGTLAAGFLAGCAGTKTPADMSQKPTTTPVSQPAAAQPIRPEKPESSPAPDAIPMVQRFTFASLPGWDNGDHVPVLTSLKTACERRLAGKTADKSIGGLKLNNNPVFGLGSDWADICQAAQKTRDTKARAFFEKWFEPVSVNGAGKAQSALFTAYFEPELRGSRKRGGAYQYPLYARPDDLEKGKPYLDRQAIYDGGLAGRGLELYWVDDPVDAFFLEIQGSGRVRLPNGDVARVGYAGKNNHRYVAVGRTLVEWEEMPLEKVSMQSIKQWIKDNPDRREKLLATNPSYVFFEDKPELAADPNLGPIGSFGMPLPSLRAIAIDPKTYALGIPFWVDFDSPAGPMKRLVLGLDTGGAIKGPKRVDFFFGSGHGAGIAAGKTRNRGRLIALAPTAALRRIFQAGS